MKGRAPTPVEEQAMLEMLRAANPEHTLELVGRVLFIDGPPGVPLRTPSGKLVSDIVPKESQFPRLKEKP